MGRALTHLRRLVGLDICKPVHRPPIFRYLGPCPSQRQRSSVRGLILQRRESSTWFKCVMDIANHLGFERETEGFVAMLAGEDRRPNWEKRREKSD
jgi:hypothetical protein